MDKIIKNISEPSSSSDLIIITPGELEKLGLFQDLPASLPNKIATHPTSKQKIKNDLQKSSIKATTSKNKLNFDPKFLEETAQSSTFLTSIPAKHLKTGSQKKSTDPTKPDDTTSKSVDPIINRKKALIKETLLESIHAQKNNEDNIVSTSKPSFSTTEETSQVATKNNIEHPVPVRKEVKIISDASVYYSNEELKNMVLGHTNNSQEKSTDLIITKRHSNTINVPSNTYQKTRNLSIQESPGAEVIETDPNRMKLSSTKTTDKRYININANVSKNSKTMCDTEPDKYLEDKSDEKEHILTSRSTGNPSLFSQKDTSPLLSKQKDTEVEYDITDTFKHSFDSVEEKFGFISDVASDKTSIKIDNTSSHSVIGNLSNKKIDEVQFADNLSPAVEYSAVSKVKSESIIEIAEHEVNSCNNSDKVEVHTRTVINSEVKRTPYKIEVPFKNETRSVEEKPENKTDVKITEKILGKKRGRPRKNTINSEARKAQNSSYQNDKQAVNKHDVSFKSENKSTKEKPENKTLVGEIVDVKITGKILGKKRGRPRKNAINSEEDKSQNCSYQNDKLAVNKHDSTGERHISGFVSDDCHDKSTDNGDLKKNYETENDATFSSEKASNEKIKNENLGPRKSTNSKLEVVKELFKDKNVLSKTENKCVKEDQDSKGLLNLVKNDEKVLKRKRGRPRKSTTKSEIDGYNTAEITTDSHVCDMDKSPDSPAVKNNHETENLAAFSNKKALFINTNEENLVPNSSSKSDVLKVFQSLAENTSMTDDKREDDPTEKKAENLISKNNENTQSKKSSKLIKSTSTNPEGEDLKISSHIIAEENFNSKNGTESIENINISENEGRLGKEETPTLRNTSKKIADNAENSDKNGVESATAPKVKVKSKKQNTMQAAQLCRKDHKEEHVKAEENIPTVCSKNERDQNMDSIENIKRAENEGQFSKEETPALRNISKEIADNTENADNKMNIKSNKHNTMQKAHLCTKDHKEEHIAEENISTVCSKTEIDQNMDSIENNRRAENEGQFSTEETSTLINRSKKISDNTENADKNAVDSATALKSKINSNKQNITQDSQLCRKDHKEEHTLSVINLANERKSRKSNSPKKIEDISQISNETNAPYRSMQENKLNDSVAEQKNAGQLVNIKTAHLMAKINSYSNLEEENVFQRLSEAISKREDNSNEKVEKRSEGKEIILAKQNTKSRENTLTNSEVCKITVKTEPNNSIADDTDTSVITGTTGDENSFYQCAQSIENKRLAGSKGISLVNKSGWSRTNINKYTENSESLGNPRTIEDSDDANYKYQREKQVESLEVSSFETKNVPGQSHTENEIKDVCSSQKIKNENMYISDAEETSDSRIKSSENMPAVNKFQDTLSECLKIHEEEDGIVDKQIKRKRGRPRKDQNTSLERSAVSGNVKSLLGEMKAGRKRNNIDYYELEHGTLEEDKIFKRKCINPSSGAKLAASDVVLDKNIQPTIGENDLEIGIKAEGNDGEQLASLSARKNRMTGDTRRMIHSVFAASLKNTNNFQKTENELVDSPLQPRKRGRRKKINDESVIIDDEGRVRCVACNEKVLNEEWPSHNRNIHYELSWREGDNMLNIDDDIFLKKKLKPILKDDRKLSCYKCNAVRYTVTDFLVHKEECEGIVLGGLVTCVICQKQMEKTKWHSHKLRRHNNLAWRNGDPPMDLNNEVFVLSVLNALYKMKRPLYCDKCGTNKKSVVGFLSHRAQCGVQLQEAKVACDLCGKYMLPVSLLSHFKFVHENPKKQDKMDLAKSEYFEIDPGTCKKKRKAAKAALLVMDSFKNQILNEHMKHYVSQMDFKEDDFVNNLFKKELEENYMIKCKFQSCDFEAEDTEVIADHMNSCSYKMEQFYACQNCLYLSPTEEGIWEHLKMTHNIVVSTTNDSDSSTNADDLKYKESKRRKIEKTKNEKAGNTFNRRKPLCILDIPKCKRSLFTRAFEYTLEFCNKNFTQSVLFDCWRFSELDWLLLDEKLLDRYMPKSEVSCSVTRRVVSDIENVLQYKHALKTFELFESENGDGYTTIFCGGPIYALAWLPTPHILLRCNQMLAVSAGNSFDTKYKVDENYSEPFVIQFWDFGVLKNKVKPSVPTLHFCLAIDYGPVWHMEWCPSGCYDEKETRNDGRMRRMGLIAIAGSISTVHIYSVPFLEEEQKGLTYKAKPLLKLQLLAKKEFLKRNAFSTKVSWSKTSGHRTVAVGYTDGMVGIFDLQTTSKSLKFIDEDGVDVLLPYKTIKAHTHYISVLALIPLGGGANWLLTGSFDKYIYTWDLNNNTNVTVYKKKMVADGIWLTNWVSHVSSGEESATNISLVNTVLNTHRFFLSDQCTITYSPTTFTSISSSDWLNGIIQSSAVGELIVVFPHQLLYSMDSEKNTKRYKYFLGYAKLIDKNKSPEERTTDEIENQNALTPLVKTEDSEYRAELKSSKNVNEHYELNTYEEASGKYGLVFCDIKMNDFDDFSPRLQAKFTGNHDALEKSKPNLYPMQAINKVSFNPNCQASLYYATGYQAGFVRLTYLKFLEKDRQVV